MNRKGLQNIKEQDDHDQLEDLYLGDRECAELRPLTNLDDVISWPVHLVQIENTTRWKKEFCLRTEQCPNCKQSKEPIPRLHFFAYVPNIYRRRQNKYGTWKETELNGQKLFLQKARKAMLIVLPDGMLWRLREISVEYGGLTNLDFFYARYGSSRDDTKHILLPSESYPMPEELVELIKTLSTVEEYIKSCLSQYN